MKDESFRSDGANAKNVGDMSYAEVKEFIRSLGEPVYRADQLMKWIYTDCVVSFDEMTDIPLKLRAALARETSLPVLEIAHQKLSKDKSTRKVLSRLKDGRTIESVLMTYRERRLSRGRTTVCVSTQVGCPIGCPFCATGQQGFERNLTAGEMIAQSLHFKRLLLAEAATNWGKPQALTNVVFMGMGEPLANYESVLKCIELLNSKSGLGIARRQITISTVGIVPQIRRLAGEPIHVELAVSLHGANDNTRSQLIPLNRRYPLRDLLDACAYYFERTGRQPSFEYALFDGINDSLTDARQLAKLLGGTGGHLNLIAGNLTANKRYRPSSRQKMGAFHQELNERGISNTLRLYRGLDIRAGCGQLRSRSPQKM